MYKCVAKCTLTMRRGGGAHMAQVKGMFWLKLIGLIMYFACLAVSSPLAKEPAIQEHTGLSLVSVYLTFSLCPG